MSFQAAPPPPTSAWKNPCKVATVPGLNIAFNNAPSVVDGVSLALGDRVLVKDQTAPSGAFSPQNGIYAVISVGNGGTGIWQRAVDANTSPLMQGGATVYVEWGATNSKQIFHLTSTGNLILDVTGLRFEPFVPPTPPSPPSGGGLSVTPFSSVAAAQAASSSAIGVGNLIFVVGAVNPGALNTYQLLSGTPTQSSPYQFVPNDNSGLYYSIVS